MDRDLDLLFMISSVTFFYIDARGEGHSVIYTPAASIALWVSASWLLGWGILGGVLGQVLLFVMITAWRMRPKKAEPEEETP